MNAIVSGKMEKVANSIVIETVRDLPAVAGVGVNISITAEEYNSGNYYLYFIDYYNHAMLVNIRSLPNADNEQAIRVYMRNNAGVWQWITFVYQYVGNRAIIFNAQQYPTSTILTKFAIVKIS